MFELLEKFIDRRNDVSMISDLLGDGPIVESSSSVPQSATEILNRLARLVGCVAIGLPLILLFGATIGGSCFRDTISHFYYAQFLGPIFVGLVCFIGGFLPAYCGDHPLEDWGSTIAGLGAFVLSLFPTKDSGCELEKSFLSRVFVEVTNGESITVAEARNEGFFNLFDTGADWHMVAAGIIFIYLGLFCLYVLRRVLADRHIRDGKIISSKLRRNRLYRVCGIVILVCVAVLALTGWFGSEEFLAWWNG
jgi:hypothetical protein